ncbi:putative fatty acid binding protein [Podospora didyma]|uniref:Fatty acid binding protein n=1 Tax=Podospora didyma TaxID=330526 RepID=A0AAE0NYV8_9PEZI|nr:putative fatty acid binding protein [Podospora didyma]
MSVPQSDAFKKAAVDSKKLTSKPSNEDLLEIYALYKGKAKYNAWAKLADESLTPEQAQEKYVTKIEEMKEAYGYDENKEPEAVGAN